MDDDRALLGTCKMLQGNATRIQAEWLCFYRNAEITVECLCIPCFKIISHNHGNLNVPAQMLICSDHILV